MSGQLDRFMQLMTSSDELGGLMAEFSGTSQDNRKLLPHTHTTHSPSSFDMAVFISRCISKSDIIEQGFNFSFAPFFREVFFCDSIPVGW